MRHSLTAAIALVLALSAAAQTPFYVKDGDSVVFYGDSITDQRLYTTFTESFIVTRFPDLNVNFTHSGWGGDRVTGGGGGPIDVRLARNVFPYRPTVMTIMLGMNDGNYKPLDDGTFQIYKTGFEHILDSVKKEFPSCRITLIQPSAYDDVTREPSFPGGYNATLLRFSDYLKTTARSRHLDLADLNNPVSEMLRKAMALDPAQATKILPDRVHPAPAGHIVMAEALLRAWNAPALVSETVIDGAAGTSSVKNARVEGLKTGSRLSWTETESALPVPLDPRDKLMALALSASDFVDSLDRETLAVSGLQENSYELKIDGALVATFSKEDLARGVNLATLDSPMLRQALEVHALTHRHNNVHFTRWRTIQTGLPTDGSPATKREVMESLDKLEGEIVAEQRAAAQPRPHRYELNPVQ